jgi:hypothetical protein
LQIIIDSVAALARKEALSEREKELYFINQVRLSLCHHHLTAWCY